MTVPCWHSLNIDESFDNKSSAGFMQYRDTVQNNTKRGRHSRIWATKPWRLWRKTVALKVFTTLSLTVPPFEPSQVFPEFLIAPARCLLKATAARRGGATVEERRKISFSHGAAAV